VQTLRRSSGADVAVDRGRAIDLDELREGEGGLRRSVHLQGLGLVRRPIAVLSEQSPATFGKRHRRDHGVAAQGKLRHRCVIRGRTGKFMSLSTVGTWGPVKGTRSP